MLKADPNKEKFKRMVIESGMVDCQSMEPQRHKLFELHTETVKEPWQEEKVIWQFDCLNMRKCEAESWLAEKSKIQRLIHIFYKYDLSDVKSHGLGIR